MVGQLTLDQPVVVRIHVREPPISAHASCVVTGGFFVCNRQAAVNIKITSSPRFLKVREWPLSS